MISAHSGEAWQAAVDLHNASRSTTPYGEPVWDLKSERAVLALLPRLVAAKGPEAAMAMVEEVEDPFLRDQCFLTVAAALPEEMRDVRQSEVLARFDVRLEKGGFPVYWLLRDVAGQLGEPALRCALALVAAERQRRRGGFSTDELEKAEIALRRRLGACGHVEEARRHVNHLHAKGRVELLAALAAMLPEIQRGPLIEDALRTFDDSLLTGYRAEALKALATVLGPESIEAAVAIASGLKEEKERAETMCAIVQRWGRIASPGVLLPQVLNFSDAAVRGGALAGLAPMLTNTDEVIRAAEAVRDLPCDYWTEPIYAAVAARLAECGCIAEAIVVAEKAGSTHSGPVVAAIAPWLDVEAVMHVLLCPGISDREASSARISLATRLVALGEGDRGIEEVESLADLIERCKGLRAAVMALPDDDAAMARRVWQRCLRSASGRRRDEALLEVAAVLPLALRFGGVGVISEILGAARQVLATWP